MLVTMGFNKYLRGFRKSAVFALTTQCNCKCIMCNIHRKSPEHISFEDAKKILDFLYKNKFLLVYFTGGEPTLYPNIVELVQYANRLGLITTMTTNGTASKTLLKALKDADLSLLSVSLDHWDEDVCSQIRGRKGIKSEQVNTIRYAKSIGLRTYALAFLNNFLLRDGVGRLIRDVNEELGVPFGFCYPTTCDDNTYSLSGISNRVLHEDLEIAIRTIFSLRRRYEIANDGLYIEDVLRSFKKEPPNFFCRGGQDVVYVDWLGDVYPCFHKSKLFNALKDKKYFFLESVRCNDCFINCFREPSLITQLTSPSILLKESLYHSSRRVLI